MLDHITGTVHGITEEAAVISVGGVGIRVEMPTGDLAKLAGTVTVFTVLQIRDEEVHLYGFRAERARELFRALTTVSGVGPKVALAILSFHSIDARFYAGSGWLEAHYGLDPYRHVASDVPAWRDDPMFSAYWADRPSVYGFLFADAA